ncbi:hypothetical protein [Nonomuraea rubra]|uniref:hypothetical protein n=1 Tax=Nonomuraea rubra TaxID=46180 RepID=UPI00340DC523
MPAAGARPRFGHGGTLATWTGDMVFSPAKGVAAVVLTNSVGDPALLSANLLAGRLGVPATPMSNPLTAVNAVLLGLTAGMAALLVTAAVRARRWAARRRAARRPWLVPRLLPLAVVTVLGVLLPALMGVQAGVFSFQYWIVTAWLLPLLVLFSLTCCVLGTVALARRLWCLRRAGHASTLPSSPPDTTTARPPGSSPAARPRAQLRCPVSGSPIGAGAAPQLNRTRPVLAGDIPGAQGRERRPGPFCDFGSCVRQGVNLGCAAS